MAPGEHLIVIGNPNVRHDGLQVRDTLLILTPGPNVLCAWLLRRPLEGTVVENVIARGAGALNVDACRVSFNSAADRVSAFPGGKVTSRKVTGGGLGCGFKEHERGDFNAEQSSLGRWPTNLVFVHGPGCRAVGTRKVDPGGGGTARRTKGVSNQVAYGGNIGRFAVGTPDLGYVGSDGLETVAAWACEPGCPVALLDGVSGTLTSGTKVIATRSRESTVEWRFKEGSSSYGDSGTASRFYPQFASLPECMLWLGRLIERVV